MDIGLIAFVAIFIIFALAGAWFDLRKRIIPNWLNGAFLVAGLVLGIVCFWPEWQFAAWGLAHFAVTLLVGMALFALRVLGGGDVKFYAASAAWFPLQQGIGLFVSVALAGLVLVLAYILIGKIAGKKLDRRAMELPYGIAIAGGGIIMQLSNPALGLLT